MDKQGVERVMGRARRRNLFVGGGRCLDTMVISTV